jgi:carbon-monoxide dehydrogenase large subunit
MTAPNTAAPSIATSGIGAAVKRKEDVRFLTGKGRYVDDINLPGQLHAVLVRSPHAHAEIERLNIAAAQAAPGVVAIFTGADMAADKVGSLPCGWGITNRDGSPAIEPPHPPLAHGRVRHVGDPVAVVIADTKRRAQQAAELLAVEYDELPANVDTARALAEGTPQIWPQAAHNVCFDWELGNRAETAAAFEKARHIAKIDIVNQRMVTNAMEPRAAIADFNAASGDYTLYTTTQNPHVIRLLMGAFVLNIPEHKLRVVAPDVGGGFGAKIPHYAEEAILTWAAGKLARPIKWTSDRSEAFLSDTQGRDHVTHAELALDEHGKFLGMRVDTIANLGAYLSTFSTSIPTYLYGTVCAGCYATPAIYVNVRAVFTNTVPVDAARGAGRPEASFLVERLIDVAARQLGLDPVELRRKNFVRPNQFPYQTPVALQYDTGNYEATLKLALQKADYAGFPARRAAAKQRGKLRGIGVSTYIEACGLAPSAVVGSLGARAGLYESGQVRVHPTGSVTVYTGSHSHGQGHETTFAQIVSQYLGVPIDLVEVVHGDTSNVAFGMGTYGSRSLAVGGSAIVKALGKIIDKGKQIAAHLLEAGAGDITFENGKFTVAGTDRSKTFAEVALTAYVPHNFPHDRLEPGLDANAFYDPSNFTYPAGCHIVELEVDPDTGTVELSNVVAADDFGNIINPMIVEGQVHGGLAHGIGQALLENCVYDRDTGQLLTGSFLNYAMPRAADLPSFIVATETTACTHNPLGVKGCGEAGAIGVCPAVINAVVDALSEYGITHIDMPASPERVWRAIQTAQRRA